jgi:hypothetical protein
MLGKNKMDTYEIRQLSYQITYIADSLVQINNFLFHLYIIIIIISDQSVNICGPVFQNTI